MANGQVTNLASIARDAGAPRPTVQGYFEVLVDTLIGSWLPAWRPRAKVKEQSHPKFHFFDAGVTRAIAGRLHEPLDSVEHGTLIETTVFHELRAEIGYSGVGGELSYWRTPSGSEVDFVWHRGSHAVGIEVKAVTTWRADAGAALRDLIESRVIHEGYGVYLGDRAPRDGPVTVLPLVDFSRRLARGQVLVGARKGRARAGAARVPIGRESRYARRACEREVYATRSLQGS